MVFNACYQTMPLLVKGIFLVFVHSCVDLLWSDRSVHWGFCRWDVRNANVR